VRESNYVELEWPLIT